MTEREELRQRIIDLRPEIYARNTSMRLEEPFQGIINHRDETIRLADLLIVIGKYVELRIVGNAFIITVPEYRRKKGKLEAMWNLNYNSLDAQTEIFVHTILAML